MHFLSILSGGLGAIDNINSRLIWIPLIDPTFLLRLHLQSSVSFYRFLPGQVFPSTYTTPPCRPLILLRDNDFNDH